MIRVLHVVGKRPRGGVGTFLINMNTHIDSNLITFDYLICDRSKEDGSFDKAVKALGAKVYVLPELNYKNTFKYLTELNRFYKLHHNYDIVHVHSPNIGVFNFFWAKKYGIKHRILHSHNTKYSDKLINAIRNYFIQLPLGFYVTSKMACSIKAGEFLFGKKAMKNGEVTIAKNAINADKFRYNNAIRMQIRNELNLNDKFVIGHIGRFNAQKNHIFLLRIFEQVKKYADDAVLLLVGDGELEQEIRKKTDLMGLSSSVMFMGLRNDVQDLLQAIDVFVLPSLFEGLPLVGIEVQAAGVPCIMSDSITNEIKVTDIIEFMSLSDDPLKWAMKIMAFKNFERKDMFNDILEAGYEEADAAKELQNYYINLINKD